MVLIRLFLLPSLIILAYDVTCSVYKKYQRAKPMISMDHSNFTRLVMESDIFVDKTLLIKDFIESPADVVLVTCPRRWGKSINIDMIKTFLQIVVDSKGKRANKTDAFNSKLFRLDETDPSLPKLEIAKHVDLMDRFLGEYPVIHMSFENCTDFNYKQAVNSLAFVASKVFEDHLYLIEIFWQTINNPNATKSDKDKAKAHLDEFVKVFSRKANDVEVLQSIKFLSERLFECFGKKVFIFIDDFDAMLKGFYTFNTLEVRPKDVELTWQLLQEFAIASFLKNANFYKALIAGVVQLETKQIFAEFERMRHYSMLHNEFFAHFGLTNDEVTQLSKDFNLPDSKLTEASSYYGGYRLTNTNTSLYNSYSVLKFLSDQVAQPHLDSTEGPFERLFSKEKINQAVKEILNATSKFELANLTFTVSDFFRLKGMVQYEALVPDEGIAVFIRLLFAEGYLTMNEETVLGVNVKVPNKEVTHVLKDKVTVEVDSVDYGALL